MSEVSVEQGIVLGFGGTNARRARNQSGEIFDFAAVDTPTQPKAFFDWMAGQLLHAADAGNKWVVAGYPGPVSADGTMIGPFKNVPGLSRAQYNLPEELTAADPAAGRLLASREFSLVSVNDGTLAAHAAATRIGESKYGRVAALILGSGVGTGIVDRDVAYSNVYRADPRIPAEIGHVPLSADPTDTFENAVSGTALARVAIAGGFGEDSRYLPPTHPAWRRTGETVGRMANLLGPMLGVELVVPCGGVGSGAYAEYGPHLDALFETYKEFGNATQILFMPEIVPVPKSDRQVFEMYGGEGVIRDIQTRAA
jgi:predicted NBD/HSP70 family sugar kinase